VAFYRQVGEVPPKRHTQFRRPDGWLYYEELVGEEGFSSDSSLLYHAGVPSAMVDARPWELPDQSLTPNAPLTPRHLKLHDLFPGEEHKATDPVTGRRLVLGNADVRISYLDDAGDRWGLDITVEVRLNGELVSCRSARCTGRRPSSWRT
jgi:homogentisate 1,2-dioxygenase